MHSKMIRGVSLVLIGCASVPAAAAGDSWQYEVTPHFLAAGLDGKAGVRGVTSDIDMSFSDIMDDFEGGFMGLFTASKGPWSYGLEGVYFKLADQGAKSVTGPFGNVAVTGALELTTKMYIYQATVGYRVLDGATSVDLLGALRYTELDVDATVVVTTVPAIVFPGGTRSASGSDSWTDVVVGARVLHPLTDNVALLGYADVGGGGSDLTWQVMAGVNWEFSKGYTAKVGYRMLDWDYEDGGTVWDMTASGMYMGLGIRF